MKRFKLKPNKDKNNEPRVSRPVTPGRWVFRTQRPKNDQKLEVGPLLAYQDDRHVEPTVVLGIVDPAPIATDRRVIEEAPQMLDLLRFLQWSVPPTGGGKRCPCCRAVHRKGATHRKFCRIAKIIRRVDRGEPYDA